MISWLWWWWPAQCHWRWSSQRACAPSRLQQRCSRPGQVVRPWYISYIVGKQDSDHIYFSIVQYCYRMGALHWWWWRWWWVFKIPGSKSDNRESKHSFPKRRNHPCWRRSCQLPEASPSMSYISYISSSISADVLARICAFLFEHYCTQLGWSSWQVKSVWWMDWWVGLKESLRKVPCLFGYCPKQPNIDQSPNKPPPCKGQ